MNRLCAAGCALAFAALPFQGLAAVVKINNYDDFKSKVAAGVADSFVLTANIDCKGDNFRRIGGLEEPFIGKLNGAKFIIQNVKVDAGNNGYAGLFGYLGKGALIENLGVIADTVKGDFAVGVLAGGSDGTVRNCFSKGVVIANGNSAGGLVGINGGVIQESYSEASVRRGKNNVGGLVGLQTVNVSGAGITNSFATGAVSGVSSVGGLVGYVFGGSVKQCLAMGRVTGTSNAGGLIGYDYGSVNTGWKTAGKTGTGETVQKADVKSCFWNRETTGQKTSAGQTGKTFAEGITTDEMKNPNTYDGTWRPNVWTISGDDRPYLINVPQDPTRISIKGAEVKLSDTLFTYNGEKQKPEILSVKLNGTELRRSDYTWDIEPDNPDYWSDGTIVGIVKIRIDGAGKYGDYRYESYRIKKAPGANVGNPVLETVTITTVKIAPVTTTNGQEVEYAISRNNAAPADGWEIGKLEFTEDAQGAPLAQGTTYHVFARSAANRNYEAGSPSHLAVETKTLQAGVAVAAPELQTKTHNSITIQAVTTENGQQVEYAISQTNEPTGEWRQGLEFTGLAQNTTYYIFARSVGNDDYGTGQPSEPLEVTTDILTKYIMDWPEEDITMGSTDVVTLSVNIKESPNDDVRLLTYYKWYYYGLDLSDDWLEYVSITIPISAAENQDSYPFKPASNSIYVGQEAIYFYIQVIDMYEDENGDLAYDTVYSPPIKVTITDPSAPPELGKKSVLSAVAVPGAVVRGRTLVISSPSGLGMQVRLIDMRGRTAARFVSGRNASIPLSGLPTGRYILETREKGRRVSARPVMLK